MNMFTGGGNYFVPGQCCSRRPVCDVRSWQHSAPRYKQNLSYK